MTAVLHLPATSNQKETTMQAGFSRVCVNPLVGDPLEGLGRPNSTGFHDDLHLGCCWLTEAGRDILIIGCDLLFFERKEADRFKGALGRQFDLPASHILLNTSHNHAGPRLTRWAYSDGPDQVYLDQVEAAILEAAATARARRRNAHLAAGMTSCDIPYSRRLIGADGKCQWAPSAAGPTCTALPVCHITDDTGGTIALLFSVSCHPSTWYETLFSADFPGVAQNLLNARFDTEGALFLQGAGGDTKARTIAEGLEYFVQDRGFAPIEAAGRAIAEAVTACVEHDCVRIQPDFACVYEDMRWPLREPPSQEELEKIAALPYDPGNHREAKRPRWAADMLNRLRRFGRLPDAVPVGLHGIQLGAGLRFIGLEGEAVADLGNLILTLYGHGVTFPLSYTNGAQLYLPVSRMHAEGGYEVDCFYEYHWPAELQPGEERILTSALRAWQQSGALPNTGG